MRRVLTNRAWLLPGLALSMSLYGLAYLGASVASWFPLVLVLVFVAHFGGGSNWVMSNFALQGEVPDRLRGRVFATDMMLATLADLGQSAGGGRVVDMVDERVVLAGCGLVTLRVRGRLADRHPPALAHRPGRRAGARPRPLIAPGRSAWPPRRGGSVGVGLRRGGRRQVVRPHGPAAGAASAGRRPGGRRRIPAVGTGGEPGGRGLVGGVQAPGGGRGAGGRRHGR